MADKVVRNLEDDFETTPKADIDAIHDDELLNVFLRIRPFLPSERKQNCESCVEIESSQSVVLHAPKDSVTYKNSQRGATQVCHDFTFTHVFRPDTDQQTLFDNCMVDMMRNFLAGQNCLIFAYGATNAGKTYTMQGSQDDPGILPRSLDVLFNSIHDCMPKKAELMPVQYDTVRVLSPEESRREEMLKDNLFHHCMEWDGEVSTYLSCDSSVSRSSASLFSDDSLNATKTKNSRENLTLLKENLHRMFAGIEQRARDETTLSVDSDVSHTVWVSFCEIYNEYIHDLLDYENQSLKRRPILKLAGDMRGNVYVKGCRQLHITSADEAIKLILIGQKNLRVASTKLNQRSSRSHSIFSVRLVRSYAGGRTNKASVQILSFCDLAGSERYAKTQSHGDRLTEAKNINTSLLVLGRCIQMLRENQCSKDNLKLIPFRESKLTHLLQNFFIKKGKVSLIVNISQDGKVFDENLHVLKYSAIAKQIRIVPDLDITRHQRGTKVSLILAQGFGSRSSVAWSTTSSEATDLKSRLTDTVAEASDENEDDDDAIGDKTLSELYDQIENLQQELAKEKKAKQLLELEIRAEVAAEVQVCIEEMDKYYEERMKEIEIEAEELAEQRMASLMRAVNRHKESSSAHNSDKDEVAGELEVQIENQTETISKLEAQLEDLKCQLDKEVICNKDTNAVLSELGCNDIQELMMFWLKQKTLIEEFQGLAESNAMVATAHQGEKEILEEQLQCLREKFASEVNKTLMLQHDLTKRERELAKQAELVEFLSEIGCSDVALVKEQWLKYQQLQEKILHQETNMSDVHKVHMVNDVIQGLGFASIIKLKEEWDKRERLINEFKVSNESCIATSERYKEENNDLKFQLLELQEKVTTMTKMKEESENKNADAQGILDDLGVGSLALLRDEWILRYTLQQELTESNHALREQIAIFQQELTDLKQMNQDILHGKTAAEEKISLLKAEMTTFVQSIQELNEKVTSLSKLNCLAEDNKIVLETNVQSCQEVIQELQAAKNAMEINLLECETTISDLQLNKTDLEKELASCMETIGTLHNSKNALEVQVLACKEAIYALKEGKGPSEDKITLNNRTECTNSSPAGSGTLSHQGTIATSSCKSKLALGEEISCIITPHDNTSAVLSSSQEETIRTLNAKKDFLEGKLLSYEETIHTLQAEKTELEEAILSLKSECCTTTAEQDLLRRQLEMAQQKNQAFGSKGAAYEILQEVMEVLKYSVAENEINSDVTDDIKAIEAAGSTAEVATSSFKQGLLHLKHISIALTETFKQTVSSLKNANDSLFAENNLLKQKLKDEHKKECGFERRVHSLEMELAAKSREASEKGIELSQLKECLSETKNTMDMHTKTVHKLEKEELQDTIKHLHSNLEAIQIEKSELGNRLEHKIKQACDLEMLIKKIQDQLEGIRAEKIELAGQFECNVKHSSELEKSVKELSNKLETIQIDKTNLGEALEHKIKELLDLQNTVEKLHNKLETVQAENLELAEQLDEKIKESSNLEKSFEKLHREIETGQAEKMELVAQLENKVRELSEQVGDKNNLISSLKVDLHESRKLEEDSACKHIHSKNKLQEILTLFSAKTLDDIKAKMNEYEPLKNKIKQLEKEMSILKDNLMLSRAQIKEQSEKMLALEMDHKATELAHNEHTSTISCELRALQEFLVEEFGSLGINQVRKNIASLHIAKEERNLLKAKNQELESKLLEKSSECECLLQSKNMTLEEMDISKLHETPCDCDDFKEPLLVTRAVKKTRSRKTRGKSDLKDIGSRSGVTTRSSGRRQKPVLEESNSQEVSAYNSDSSTSDSSVTSISLRSRRLYKENVSLLESSPQNMDTKQTSAYSAVMKKLQRS